MSNVIHLFRYYTPKALCGELRNHEDAIHDRVDRVPDTQPNCMACIALRKDDGDVLFAYPGATAPTTKCCIASDGVAHAVAPSITFGWVFRLCDDMNGDEMLHAMEFKHLKDAVVTCIACLDKMNSGSA